MISKVRWFLYELFIAPIAKYLAFNQAILEIQSMLPPKQSRQLQLAKKIANGLPKDLRGPFFELISDKIKSNYDFDIAVGDSVREILNFSDKDEVDDE